MTQFTMRLMATLAMPLLCAPGMLCAQSILEVRAEDSNGQFDFWVPFARRPDDEYTNGARLSVLFAGAPFWGHPCSAARAGDARGAAACTTTELAIGQDIYTPANAFDSPFPAPGERPYAGWLYSSATAQRNTTTASDGVTTDLGVTGPPSLAEHIQNTVHRVFGFSPTLGWAHQIPTQLGARLAYQHDQQIVRVIVGSVPVFTVTPYATGSVGNVLTGATAGVEGRAGYGVTAPWSAAIPGRARKVEIYALSGIREDWILHEMVLDEPTVDPSFAVAKIPWVTQYEVGGGVRWWAFEAEYRVFRRGREYTTGPAGRTYGELSAGVRTAP